MHPQNHKHGPKTFGEPFGEFASHMHMRFLALHSEVTDKVSDYTFGLRTVSDKVSVRSFSDGAPEITAVSEHVENGPSSERVLGTPKTWQLSQVCVWGGSESLAAYPGFTS